jgi:hypothetical protein
MDARLIGPRLKVRRALRGLQELGAQMTAFTDTKPYEILVYDDLNTRERIYQVRIYQEPPSELGVVVGEIAHNLRSALDHMARLLPIAPGKVRPERPTFPIFTLHDPDPTDTKRKYFSRNHQLQWVSPEAFAVVEGLQPYHSTDEPSGDPLAVLHDLWNWDKHNAIHIVAASLRPPRIEGQIVTEGVTFAPEGPVYDGQILGRVPLDGFQVVNDNPEPMNLSFTIEPAFGGGGPASGKLLFPTLAGLCNYVGMKVMGPLERVITEAGRHDDAP